MVMNKNNINLNIILSTHGQIVMLFIKEYIKRKIIRSSQPSICPLWNLMMQFKDLNKILKNKSLNK
jgi:hypothetical protein